MNFASVLVSPKFQIVIPKKIREEIDLSAGEKLTVIEKGGKIILLRSRPLSELAGLLSGLSISTKAIREKRDRV